MTMPRFHFPTWDGVRWLPDEDGLEFVDLEQARTMAIRALAELAREVLPDRSEPLVLKTCVTDARGATLAEYHLRFDVVAQAAL